MGGGGGGGGDEGGGVMKGVGVGGVCSIIPGMYATCQSKCVITHTINQVLCQVKATPCAGGRGGGGGVCSISGMFATYHSKRVSCHYS